MPRPQNFFTHLAGVPVHYDRFPDPQCTYGTRGKPLKFYAVPAFERTLAEFFEELWRVCPLGRAEVITSAGAYVDKPGSHGLGRGFDIDGIFWADRTFITLHYPQDRPFYLAVEAMLRKHFGTVLNVEFNAAHQDHFHIDDLNAVGFQPGHRSRVLFVQMMLTHVFDRPVGIDGIAGSETNGALRALLVDLKLAHVADIATDAALHACTDAVWLELMDRAAAAGFAGVAPAAPEEPDPLDLIENLYDVIEHELGGSAARKRIETALTTLLNHEETASWLQQFRDGA